MPIAPGDNLLHFRFVDKIGQGGMGEVWKAVDTTLDREVAVKLLPASLGADAERLARFDREAKLLASLNHPNIASIYGLHVAPRGGTGQEGERFLSMELVPGEDLAERLARGPVPVAEALDTARQIAEALEAAHAQGVVHRDLKPANVKRTPDGKVKVLDFGLAKALDPATVASGSHPEASPTITSLGTVAGMILGTAAYMSPEQAKGLAVDRRADIWAFGVVLYEMLTGKRLFEGETASETLASVIKDEPDWGGLPAALSAPVRRVLRRCLAKDPRRRLRDIGDVLLELTSPLEEEPAPAAPEGAAANRRGERRAWIVAAVAGAAALVLAVVALLGRGATAPEPPPLFASIPAPETVHFNFLGDFGAPPALSPDGSMLVFGGTADTGSVLWVYSLDSGEVRSLAGTSGANFPFWSPDGTAIGYFAESRLKTVPVSGGAPMTVCEATNGRGGAWGRDGVIVFSPDYRTSLYRVSAAGGEPQELTRLDTERHTTHRWPFFLPDGRRFVYLATSHDTREESQEIRLASVDGSIDRHLVSAARNAAYGAGRLLFMRGGELVAQSLDPSTAEPRGPIQRVAEYVLDDATTWHAAFTISARGDRLVYARGDAFAGTQLTWYDRSGRQLGELGERGQNDSVRLSPDGKRLAVGIGADVWILDAERNATSRFTFDEWIDDVPVWSPDGRTVYYEQYGRPDGSDLVLRRPASGAGRAEMVLESPAPVDVSPLDVSPDGRFLLFMRGVRPFIDRSDLWLLPLEGGDPVSLTDTPAAEGYARFSPDGRWIVYISNETGRFELFVVPFDAEQRRIGDGRWQISQQGGLLPVWTRNGDELMFIGLDQMLHAVSVEVAGSEIRFGPESELFRVNAYSSGRVWDATADGERLIFASFGDAPDRPLHFVAGWPQVLQR